MFLPSIFKILRKPSADGLVQLASNVQIFLSGIFHRTILPCTGLVYVQQAFKILDLYPLNAGSDFTFLPMKWMWHPQILPWLKTTMRCPTLLGTGECASVTPECWQHWGTTTVVFPSITVSYAGISQWGLGDEWYTALEFFKYSSFTG